MDISHFLGKSLCKFSTLYKIASGLSALYVSLTLSGCVAGPVYAYHCGGPVPVVYPSYGCVPGPCGPACGVVPAYGWAQPELITLNYRSSCCTEYHPNYFYRCANNRCTTYSPQAPNHCDPHPYYTQCRYTSCTPPNSQYP